MFFFSYDIIIIYNFLLIELYVSTHLKLYGMCPNCDSSITVLMSESYIYNNKFYGIFTYPYLYNCMYIFVIFQL